MSEGSVSSEILQTSPAEPLTRPARINPWGSIAPTVISAPETPSEPQVAQEPNRTERRQRELPSESSFSVSLDKAGLARIPIPEGKKGITKTHDAEIEVAKAELKALLERMKKLPEHLAFQPGITLIVGENGTGKSTLAKALYLTASCKDTEEIFRRMGNDGDLRKAAEDSVLKPYSGDPMQSAFLAQAGLAPEITKLMTLDSYAKGQRSLRYYDIPEIIGSEHRNEFEMFREGLINHYDSSGNRLDLISHTGFDLGDYRSHRQAVDHTFGRLDTDGDGSPGLYFIDEPETGMSPRRHLDIVTYLEKVIPKGSISIMPTNSVVLFESDLPRIDFEFPERGIHRPSEYATQTTGAGATVGAAGGSGAEA